MPKATTPLSVKLTEQHLHQYEGIRKGGKQKPSTSLHNSARDPLIPVSSFRNVSACYRCRLRKHKCDPSLPQCQPCSRAQVECVGYDPITKQEIPRSYVYFLETRLNYLDKLLHQNNIPVKPISAFDDAQSSSDNPTSEDGPQSDRHHEETTIPKDQTSPSAISSDPSHCPVGFKWGDFSTNIITNLLSGCPTRCRVLKGGRNGENQIKSSIRTSFFGLFSPESKHQFVDLPIQKDARQLVDRYFHHVNPFIPALHREEIEEILDQIYLNQAVGKSPRKMYILYTVLAIGAAIKCDLKQGIKRSQENTEWQGKSGVKRQKLSGTSNTSEAYEASARMHLESYLSLSMSSDQSTCLDELQAIVVLCSLALLRPTGPSLASLVDMAMRSATDLRLYSDSSTDTIFRRHMDRSIPAGKESRRLQNLRRRLWWCAYSLDRLIAPCLGRPLSIPDEVVTAPFPDIEDGHFITENAFLSALGGLTNPNYASHHQFKLRRLQSEIHRTIQSQHALRVTASQSMAQNSDAVLGLRQYDDFISWRRNMTDRLAEWKWSIPHSCVTGLSSCNLLMELGYWQTIITLYRESIRIPEQLLGISSALESKEQVMGQSLEDLEVVYTRIFEACQKTIRIYRMLKCSILVNLVHFAEYGIFIAGALFLCTIWDSENIRRSLNFQQIDSMVLMITAVLDDLSDQYPTARISTAAFKEMGAMTIEHFLSTSDTEHNLCSRSDEIAHVLTPENIAHDTSSPFSSDFLDHWNPQFAFFNNSEKSSISTSDLGDVTPDCSPKKVMLADPNPLLLTFDAPDILSQLSTGVRNFEDFCKIPASSGQLKRDFESAIDDSNSSQESSHGISKELQDEQCPILETPNPGLTDESLKGFLVGWADSGSRYN